MTAIGVITARGGSKRVPGKNIRHCAGKPLLAWTCEAALASASLDRVILSTDDDAIAAVGRECGVEVPFLRPAHLSADNTPTLPVLQHLVEWLGRTAPVDALVLLQPTSPLRLAEDIDGVVAMLKSSDADSVVTVMPFPAACRPEKLMVRSTDGAVAPFDAMRVALPEPVFVRNGPAVLAMRERTLRNGSLYGERVLGYEMPAERSVDIDTPEDFRMAELLLRGRQGIDA